MLTKHKAVDTVLPELRKGSTGVTESRTKKRTGIMKTTINGLNIELDHDAISRNAGEGVEYFATGKDEAGNILEIVWETLPDWDFADPDNADNEENSCDWDQAEITITESFAFTAAAKNIKKITGLNYNSKKSEQFAVNLSPEEIEDVISQNQLRMVTITNVAKLPIYVNLNNIYLNVNGKLMTQEDSEEVIEIANEKDNCYGDA